MEYLVSFASQPHMPHWLMAAGAALVFLGAIGIIARRRTHDLVDDEEAALFRELAAQKEERLPVLEPAAGALTHPPRGRRAPGTTPALDD